MTTLNSLPGAQWRWLNHSEKGLNYNPLYSFAYDDTLCESVGEEYSAPIVHTWIHQPTIVLGTLDSRLPYLQEAMTEQKAKGIETIVRNSGGLAVFLDPGILNISLIMKDTKALTIDAAYTLMWTFVQEMYDDASQKISAGEIVGSYCPGNYDLSIEGKKFAGVSQRRLRNGIAVQVYLAITGLGSERAAIIRDFYQTAGGEYRPSTPDVRPETMASLSEIYHQAMTTPDSEARMKRVFNDYGITLAETQLSSIEETRFRKRLHLVYERNQKVLMT
ncbi:lipoate--protein ligase family protein [Natribacillus halophilus]|uniref:Octanoyl-[GcvH]:protein N-octanoyltransferase n=1 Tax=Natribacillus halophilus TaxID=549003 RepID=A0A1G8KZD1_9BACI|nr:biotin/lipoate A/B protein ligase family protein [Natribacillus halophilus]SDI48741.1 octanoyl-[GcvH]:protein N-octanoyltransferase [Natribacillus halophilus]